MARPNMEASQVAEYRARIVAAALKLYRKLGYDAVTLRGVAASVGISHVTPYRYFRSKDELLTAVRTQVFGEFRDFLRAADSGDSGGSEPRIRMWKICLALVDYGERYPQDYRLIFSLAQPALDEYPPLAAAQAQAIEHVVSVCLQAIDRKQIQGDAATLAHLAWATIHGLMSLHLSNQLVHGRSLDVLVTEALCRLLGPDPRRQAAADTGPGRPARRSSAGRARAA